MTKRWMLLTLVLGMCLGGCAALDRAIVPVYDDLGNEIGRQPTEVTKAVAGAIPYGDVALNVLLLGYAGLARFRQAKTEKGLKATIRATKTVLEDEELKDMAEEIKDAYRREHEKSGTTSLIKLLIAKL